MEYIYISYMNKIYIYIAYEYRWQKLKQCLFMCIRSIKHNLNIVLVKLDRHMPATQIASRPCVQLKECKRTYSYSHYWWFNIDVDTGCGTLDVVVNLGTTSHFISTIQIYLIYHVIPPVSSIHNWMSDRYLRKWLLPSVIYSSHHNSQVPFVAINSVNIKHRRCF